MSFREPPRDLRILVAASLRWGRDRLVTQGPGGNTSLKSGGLLWVKRSGAHMGDGDPADWLPVDLALWRNATASGRLPAVAPTAAARPSIETVLHAAIDRAAVVHLHALDALALGVLPAPRRDAQLGAALAGLDWALAPYARPGLPLARTVRTLGSGGALPRVLILANHGLLVSEHEVGAAIKLTDDVLRRLATAVAPAATTSRSPDPAPRGMHTAVSAIQWLAHDPVRTAVAAAGCLYPDQAVFLGPRFGLLERPTDAALPVQVAAGRGVYVTEPPSRTMAEMLEGHALLLARLPEAPPDRIAFLPPAEAAALHDWEAERHRRRQAE